MKLFESFSLFTSKHRETDKKKDFIFCFCPVPLLFHFLKTFSHFLHFHHCCLCSLSPFIFLFISSCFFSHSFPSFLHSFFFSISVFLFFFLISCFLICFSPSPFLHIPSFVLDLVLLFFLLLYLFFLHQRICFFAQTNSNFLDF